MARLLAVVNCEDFKYVTPLCRFFGKELMWATSFPTTRPSYFRVLYFDRPVFLDVEGQGVFYGGVARLGPWPLIMVFCLEEIGVYQAKWGVPCCNVLRLLAG